MLLYINIQTDKYRWGVAWFGLKQDICRPSGYGPDIDSMAGSEAETERSRARWGETSVPVKDKPRQDPTSRQAMEYKKES